VWYLTTKEDIVMSTWIRRVGIVALIGGYCLMGYGLLSTLAATAPSGEEDPNPSVTKNWDKKLPNTSRFTVLTDFGGAAVRDNETGLVWEQSPETKVQNWSDARFHCTKLTTGGRKGWRLPSVHELASLVDPSVIPGPTLPAGHPFTNVQPTHYWSATLFTGKPSFAWNVGFIIGMVHYVKTTDSHSVWCARGGNNAGMY
jgi:Protein of unknown function (DUF1566)